MDEAGVAGLASEMDEAGVMYRDGDGEGSGVEGGEAEDVLSVDDRDVAGEAGCAGCAGMPMQTVADMDVVW